MRRWTLIAICLMLVFSCACTPSEIATLEAATSTPTTSPANTPTNTPTPTPSAEPTITPTATASPKPTVKQIDNPPMILKKERERLEAEANQRFDDFLSGTGAFTEERIKNEAFLADYNKETDLGCLCYVEDGSFGLIQGVILYYQKDNQGEIIAFGTKNKSKKRIITLIEYPSQSIVGNGEDLVFSIYQDRSDTPQQILQYFDRDSNYYSFLDSYIGNFTCVLMDTCLSTETSDYNQWPENIKKIYKEAIDPKVEANRALMTNINIIDNGYHDFFRNCPSVKEFYYSKSSYITTVENLDDFERMSKKNYSQLPCCETFEFFKLD